MQLDLEVILHGIGVEIIREYGDELQGRCPLHVARTGKEDRHPSWSINTKTYVHHCFSCGYAGTLTSLYRDLMGTVPEDLEWELSKQSLRASLDKPLPVAKPDGPKVDEWVLQNYADLPDPLIERRHLTRDSIDFFGIRWDSTNKVWVIPIRNPNGVLMGFQFRQKGAVINHPAGMEKSITMFGFHLFRNQDRITVVESPLDAVRFHSVGVPAVSTFGASISSSQLELLARNFRYVIAAMDNDSPGKKANDILHRNLSKRGCVVFDFEYLGLDAKDPGDIESDEILLRTWQRSVLIDITTL